MSTSGDTLIKRFKDPKVSLYIIAGMIGIILSLSLGIYLSNRQQICEDAARDRYIDHRFSVPDEQRLKEYNDAVAACRKTTSNWHQFGLISEAWAQSGSNEDPVKRYVLVGILFLIPVLLIYAMLTITFSKNVDNQNFCRDMIKTILGFVVGVGASFLK